MYAQLIPMALVLLAGIAWRRWPPGGLALNSVRQALNLLVLYLLAPALILQVMRHSTIDRTLLLVPLAGTAAVGGGLAAALLTGMVGKRFGLGRSQAGALILAASFGNGMGAALPAANALLGTQATRVPLLYDLLLTIPVVWTLGVMIAAHLGQNDSEVHPLKALLRIPPFWTLLAALALNTLGWQLPRAVDDAIAMLARAAVPLLVLMVGMSLHFSRPGTALLALPAVVIKLALAPLFALGAAHFLGMEAASQPALVLTAAAPPVAVGVVLCDRYGLDTALFSSALTLGMVAYLLLAPFLISGTVYLIPK